MKCQSFPFFAAVFALTLSWGLTASHAADETVLDTATIEATTGLKGVSNQKEGTFKVSKPRDDVSVTVEQNQMAPFMGLTSWAAFMPSGKDSAMAIWKEKFDQKLRCQPTPSVWERCPSKVSSTGARLVGFSGKQAMPKTACTK